MEGHAGAPWRRRAVARRRRAGGLLRRLLPGEHAARGGASGRLPRHPRRARALRPRGEAARESAAASVSSPAPLRPEGAQAALGSGRPAAGADRGTARRRGRAVDMGPDQLGHPVVERHPGGQAGRGAVAFSAGRPRRRAWEHRDIQGPRARRQAPGGKTLGLKGGPLSVGMAAGPVLRVPGGARAAARGRPQPRASSRGRGGRRWIRRSRSGSQSA